MQSLTDVGYTKSDIENLPLSSTETNMNLLTKYRSKKMSGQRQIRKKAGFVCLKWQEQTNIRSQF